MLIADEAETLAQLWGSQAGITVNHAARDRTGWDHLYEVSLPRLAGDGDLPTAASFTCKVQVKAINGDRRHAPIKLSNWKRAIEDPLPWFFLLIREKAEGCAREVALVHVGKDLIGRALKRFCFLALQDQRRLHRLSLAVQWDDAAVLKEPLSLSLLHAIDSAVGSDAHAYAKVKRSWFKNAGYERTNELFCEMAIGPFANQEVFQHLARVAVGIGELKSSKVTLSQIRFGRHQILNRAKSTSVSISFENVKGRSMLLNLSDADGHQLATLPVTVRTSGQLPLPDEVFVVRIQSPSVDLILDIGRKRCSAEFRPFFGSSLTPLKVIHDELTFLRCMDDRRGQSLRWTLSIEDRVLPVADIEAPEILGENHRALSEDVHAVWSIWGHLGIADSQLRLSYDQVSSMAPVARAMLKARQVNVLGAFHINLACAPDEFDVRKPLVLVTTPRFDIGAVTYVDVVALIANPEELPDINGQRWIRLTPKSAILLLERRYLGEAAKHFCFDEFGSQFEARLNAAGFDQLIAIDWKTLAG